MPDLILPVVNLNGTSRNELFRQAKRPYESLGEVLIELQLMAPHGRDYQTLNDGGATFRAAQEQHIAWIKHVSSVRDDLFTLLRHLSK